MNGSAYPTCVQYEIRMDAHGNPFPQQIYDQYGHPIEIIIYEREPGPPIGNGESRRDLLDASLFDAALFARDTDTLSDCGCLWMVT
jgi:hypothetical protein